MGAAHPECRPPPPAEWYRTTRSRRQPGGRGRFGRCAGTLNCADDDRRRLDDARGPTRSRFKGIDNRGLALTTRPWKYSLELRERAVRIYRTTDPKPQIKKLAVDLGVHPEALRGWIRQAEADAGEVR
ncbi:transposase [Streptomyces sp. NPDC060000]|uniref:transposase n=1 Tax=Streptomyces sp. NPDC060000 TaxID=3347031 RepID=UPI0036A4E326